MPSNKPPLKNFGSLIKQPPLKRLVALDEGRFGLITWLRRRWCPLGERPPWIVHDEYEWLWLYAAVEPTTGVFLFLPTVEGQCLEIFLRHLRHELAEGPIGVILDSSGSHRSGEVVWPQDMHPLYLPPYSPELNPAEQIFRHLRKNLSNTIFTTLDELQNALTARRKQHTSAFVQQCNLREGVEATISQGVRTFGMRRSRYIGEAKTHLQHVGIAAAINVCRLINWLDGIGPAPTRVSAFQRLFFAA